MDSKITFATHIQKIVDKSKRGINVLRCSAGIDWAADRQSLNRIYCALIRSTVDYGSMSYGTASASLLDKVNILQNYFTSISNM